MPDDLDMIQAVDVVHQLLQDYLTEKTEEKKTQLLIAIRHFVLKGIHFSLSNEGDVIVSKEKTHVGNFHSNQEGNRSS